MTPSLTQPGLLQDVREMDERAGVPCCPEGRGLPSLHGRGVPVRPLTAALALWCIETCTRPGDRILDPLSGTGTVGAEAVRLGRDYVGAVRDPSSLRKQLERLRRVRESGASGGFALWRADLCDTGAGAAPLPSVLEPMGPFDATLTFLTPGCLKGNASGRGLRPQGTGADPDAGFRLLPARVFAALRPGGIFGVGVVRPRRGPVRPLPLRHDCARGCADIGFELTEELVVVRTARGGSGIPTWEGASHEGLPGLSPSPKENEGADPGHGGRPFLLAPEGYFLLFRKPIRERRREPDDERSASSHGRTAPLRRSPFGLVAKRDMYGCDTMRKGGHTAAP